MNKFKAVVDRLVRETGLSRTVSRRIAQKINRLAGEVKWATPLQGAAGGAVHSKASAEKAPGSGGMILPKIAAAKPVAKNSAGISRIRPR